MIGWLFRNVAKPVQLTLREQLSKRIDRQLGIETTDEQIAQALGIDIAVFRNTQRALGWSGVGRVMRRVNLQSHDVFLDLGCGVGRVLCAAARTPVGRVVGVDIDPRMTQIAKRNVERLLGRQAEVEVVTADATSYVVPGDVNVVYLYNPFGGKVLSSVLESLIESADRSPRGIRLVYAHPFEHERVMATGRFLPTERMSLGWRPGKKWAVKLAVQFYQLDGRTKEASTRSPKSVGAAV